LTLVGPPSPVAFGFGSLARGCSLIPPSDGVHFKNAHPLNRNTGQFLLVGDDFGYETVGPAESVVHTFVRSLRLDARARRQLKFQVIGRNCATNSSVVVLRFQ
jgi:hypothetical protein